MLFPVPIEVTPQPPVNHAIVVPEPEEELIEIFPPSFVHRLFLSDDTDTGVVAKAKTMTVGDTHVL